jgi:catechol 2,3-dioxygenase-like lactoylglutathione lyase family enzyme
MHSYDHTALQVCNLDGSIQFYVDKLGFALAYRDTNAQEQEAYAFLTLVDVRLELIQSMQQ